VVLIVMMLAARTIDLAVKWIENNNKLDMYGT
jgi:hypothetical protein